MNALGLMLAVTACYTVSSLSDKYAAAKARFEPNDFTFLMCASMSFFLTLTLPFQRIAFSLCRQAFAGVALVTLCKLLLPGLALAALTCLPRVRFKAYSEKPRGTLNVILARIPNTAGMLLENAVIGISLASYSLIQPMILVTLFVISLIRRETCSRANILGGILSIAGVMGFQFCG